MSAPPCRSCIKPSLSDADYERAVSRRKGLILAAQSAALAAAAVVAVRTSEAGDWHPLPLVLLLFSLAVVSDVLTVEFRGVRVSGSFLAIVLAMVLLGPAPAAAMGASASLIDAILSRRTWDGGLNNVVTWAVFPLAGGLMAEGLVTGDLVADDALGLSLTVVAVFMATNILNFLLVAAFRRVSYGESIRRNFGSVYITVLPSEFATSLLTAVIAYTYDAIGIGAVALIAIVLFVFQYLVRAGVQAYERGEELGKRTRELASLQVGLLSTVVQTLSMRDAMTARHSAAVARYAREVARLLEVSEREQELIHTAALLHDIGKFIFPDSILFADRKLTEEEWETVKLHPEQGAKLVRRIEGYGPVADIIHSHHERVDGRGYPAGLSGDDIPLGSRIISVADTYDVMTSRDSYRRPVSSEAAIVELRRVAGSQLDPLVVEKFIEMIEAGRVEFHHADSADFELELAFERRVEAYARPRVATA
jgi:putative nucleotidyltransferase with HDIG domain